METAITQGIRVSVETMYQPAYSKPLHQEFVHAYRITIENLGGATVQLLRRHWYIWDSLGLWREVEGEGVVGAQPVLAPGQSHQYISGCPLRTEMGKMYGNFLMRRLDTEAEFQVKIPQFDLIVPFKYN
jgi:ApaG protein